MLRWGCAGSWWCLLKSCSVACSDKDLVPPGALSFPVALLRTVPSPRAAGWLCNPAGLQFLRWSMAPVGNTRAPPCRAVPLRACCLSTNKYMCSQVNPPFLCEHVSVGSLTTLSTPQYLFISSYRRAAVNSKPSASAV